MPISFAFGFFDKSTNPNFGFKFSNMSSVPHSVQVFLSSNISLIQCVHHITSQYDHFRWLMILITFFHLMQFGKSCLIDSFSSSLSLKSR